MLSIPYMGILMVLIKYSLLSESTLAISITHKSQIVHSNQFENKYQNGTDKLASITIPGSTKNDNKPDPANDVIAVNVIDQTITQRPFLVTQNPVPRANRAKSESHVALSDGSLDSGIAQTINTNNIQSNSNKYGTKLRSMPLLAVNGSSNISMYLPNATTTYSNSIQSTNISSISNNHKANQFFFRDSNNTLKNSESNNRGSSGIDIDSKTKAIYSPGHLHQADEPLLSFRVPEGFSGQSKPPANVVYFVVAVMGGAKIWSRTLERTLSEIAASFNTNIDETVLKPIYIDLPANGRFSLNVLLSLCQQTENRPLVGVVVIGNGQSAHAVAMSGTSMQLPVLWAKGGKTLLTELHPENKLQALLQPSAHEIFEAVRSLFLQIHWHSFFVLSDAELTNVLDAKDNPLKRSPLIPTIVSLPRTTDDVFKQLAQISRSTRGIILVLCDLHKTRRIMSEAQRLNMVGGHFIWLWVDTSRSSGSFAQIRRRQLLAPISKPKLQYNAQANVFKIKSIPSSNYMDEVTNLYQNGNENKHTTSNLMSIAQRYNVSASTPNKTIDKQKTTANFSEVSTRSSNSEFSHGFDPFRALQRPFIPPKQFQQHNATRERVPMNPLVLGLRVEGNMNADVQFQNKTRNRRDKSPSMANANNIPLHGSQLRQSIVSARFNATSIVNRYSDTQTTAKPPLILGMNDSYHEYDVDDTEYSSSEIDQSNEKPSNKAIEMQTGTHNNHSNEKSNTFSIGISAYRNLSEDIFDYLNADDHYKSNSKRTSAIGNNAPNSSTFVSYYQYEDFPIGLLALRPIQMNVDRHFIRSAIRLFTSTWYKIKTDANETSIDTSHQMNNFNNDYAAKPFLSHHAQQELRMRTVQIAASMYNTKIMESDTHSRRMRRKRNIFISDRFIQLSVEHYINDKSNLSSNQWNLSSTVNIDNGAVLLNTSRSSVGDSVDNNGSKLPINLIEGADDVVHSAKELASFHATSPIKQDYSGMSVGGETDNYQNTSDSPHMNITNDRNKQTIISNTTVNLIAPDNTYKQNSFTQVETSTPDDTDMHLKLLMARQASHTTVANFSPSNKMRSQMIKRQNTWWSTKEQTLASDTQLKRTFHSSFDNNHLRSTLDGLDVGTPHFAGGCYGMANQREIRAAQHFAGVLREATKSVLSGELFTGSYEKALTTNFELLNLISIDSMHPLKPPNDFQEKQRRLELTKSSIDSRNSSLRWRRVGLVSASSVRLDTIVWPGGDIVVSGLSARAKSVFRIVTALAPPFVMESELDEDGLCLRGLPCHRVSPIGRHNLTLMFNAIETRERLEEDAVEHGNDVPPETQQTDEKISHVTKCCYGLTMDLLDNIATELGFEYHLYVVRDQLFGAKLQRNLNRFIKTNTKQYNSNILTKKSYLSDKNSGNEIADEDQWNGIIGDLVSGTADMSFAPLSVSKSRADVIDFSIPYFHSGVSLLASPKTKSEIPLLAFLLPFSPELWIAIFTSLNITAVAVAVYEWLSPFGLNPWGRQRSKNFSLSSALWVMWGLLCGHLVAFKAPKSWPNKFLINVWGGFSVIFVASYTANIAALIAGLFFQHAASSYDSSLTTQRVGAPIASAAESYVQNKDRHLWEHMKKYSLNHIEDGIRGLKNGTLDLLMADSPILDYYRATDHGCSLQRIGETFVEDTYAIGMVKGFPLKESISGLIAKYSSNGYLDILTEKWYGGLPCFKYESEIVTPRPLGVAAVAGVFLLLGLGMVMGVVILLLEHWFYKYALPSLRLKPKGTIWKSRNIMFFSQKLYRFINCVELVSPHHAARELVHSIRQGQIASLFQKSIKRKEDEQRRRRKSKAQFFEMIQEIRRAQQVERQNLSLISEPDSHKECLKNSPMLFKPKPNPKVGFLSALRKENRSRSNSSVIAARRYSNESILGDRLDSIGRRLSRDLINSPPDLNKRLDSISKYNVITGRRFTSIGLSKSNETLSAEYGINEENCDNESPNVCKSNKVLKRPKITFDCYDHEKANYRRENTDSAERADQSSPASIFLDSMLQVELHSNYLPLDSKTANNSTNLLDRPPKNYRQKSLDNLDLNDVADLNSVKLSSNIVSMHQRSQMSLERLSREDLLRLSHSSQSEIHEYLKASSLDHSTKIT